SYPFCVIISQFYLMRWVWLPARLELYNYMSCLDKDAEQCITDLVEKLVSALTPSNASIDQTLTRYFELVDQRVFGKFNEIFHSDIVYERPGYPIMEGLSNLIDFYENTREIASGQHMIENKLIQGNKCVCWGRVEGKKRDESIINERFIDVFYFKGNQIIKRTTYFYKEAI
ncbi:MAG: nuclear transport factor 2 family protein, partial [Anaerolineaceae bacterium]